jgi:hypothetical protein
MQMKIIRTSPFDLFDSVSNIFHIPSCEVLHTPDDMDTTNSHWLDSDGWMVVVSGFQKFMTLLL